jgi:hypothetical protein
LILKCSYGLLGYLPGFFYGTVKAASRGIQMSATIEKACCHFVTGELIDTSQGHPHQIVFL